MFQATIVDCSVIPKRFLNETELTNKWLERSRITTQHNTTQHTGQEGQYFEAHDIEYRIYIHKHARKKNTVKHTCALHINSIEIK